MNAPRKGTRLSGGSLRFTLDGRPLTGQVGDTAASALLACGVRAMGRSVKYRRLRGVMTAGPEEPNALLMVGADPSNVPNVPATQVKLTDGTDVADVFSLTNSKPLATALVDANGDQISSFGGGTQYTEDPVAAANPVGTVPMLVRTDTPATQDRKSTRLNSSH